MYTLNEREAFEAMTGFLTAFYRRTGGDMQTLMADIRILPDGQTGDPAAWDDWLESVVHVKEARSGGDLG